MFLVVVSLGRSWKQRKKVKIMQKSKVFLRYADLLVVFYVHDNSVKLLAKYLLYLKVSAQLIIFSGSGSTYKN